MYEFEHDDEDHIELDTKDKVDFWLFVVGCIIVVSVVAYFILGALGYIK